jgi:hypothetical protein
MSLRTSQLAGIVRFGTLSNIMTPKINQKYIDELISIITRYYEDKREARIAIQEGLKDGFLKTANIPDSIKAFNDEFFGDNIVGSGYGMNNDPNINIGKYLVHKQHLIAGKLQVRSHVNKNQVFGFKSQNITNNIKDILLKLNKRETISLN